MNCQHWRDCGRSTGGECAIGVRETPSYHYCETRCVKRVPYADGEEPVVPLRVQRSEPKRNDADASVTDDSVTTVSLPVALDDADVFFEDVRKVCLRCPSLLSTATESVKCDKVCASCANPAQRISLKHGACPAGKWHMTTRELLSDEAVASMFDRVVVISLPDAEKRRGEFFRDLPEPWPFRRPEWVRAIRGDVVGVPRYFRQGGGAYGCMQSHIRVLQDAMMDGVKSVLVMEDDCTFIPEFATAARSFLSRVPNDWECLMFGGQFYRNDPSFYARGVVRPTSGAGIQRTHCYALRGNVIRDLCAYWSNCLDSHCDWAMGPFMLNRKTFAPSPFLAGQRENQSAINGRRHPTNFWNPDTGDYIVALLSAPASVANGVSLRNGGCCHFGWSKVENQPDQGIAKIAKDEHLYENNFQFDKFVRRVVDVMIQEAASLYDKVATVWHPDSKLTAKLRESMRRVYGQRFRYIEALDEDTVEAVVDRIYAATEVVPDDAAGPLGYVVPVVILKGVGAVEMGVQLHNDGTGHAGHWRNADGVDNGLVSIYAHAYHTPQSRRSAVQDWYRNLASEAIAEKREFVVVTHQSADEVDFEGTSPTVLRLDAAAVLTADVVKSVRDRIAAKPT